MPSSLVQDATYNSALAADALAAQAAAAAPVDPAAAVVAAAGVSDADLSIELVELFPLFSPEGVCVCERGERTLKTHCRAVCRVLTVCCLVLSFVAVAPLLLLVKTVAGDFSFSVPSQGVSSSSNKPLGSAGDAAALAAWSAPGMPKALSIANDGVGQQGAASYTGDPAAAAASASASASASSVSPLSATSSLQRPGGAAGAAASASSSSKARGKRKAPASRVEDQDDLMDMANLSPSERKRRERYTLLRDQAWPKCPSLNPVAVFLPDWLRTVSLLGSVEGARRSAWRNYKAEWSCSSVKLPCCVSASGCVPKPSLAASARAPKIMPTN